MENLSAKNHKLRAVSPFIYWLCWAYAGTNQCIGLGLIHIPLKVLHYPFVTHAFSNEFYGAVFIAMGVAGAVALLLNSWQGIRRIMMFGLAIKALFFYGLLITLSWQTLGVFGVWTLIAVTQFLTVVYFPGTHKDVSA